MAKDACDLQELVQALKIEVKHSFEGIISVNRQKVGCLI